MPFNPGMISGIGQALGGIGSLFGNKKYTDPSDSANNYLNQIPGQMSPYYQPFINSGQDALGKLKGKYGQLMDDPGELFNQLGGGYKESPGYQFALQQALNAGNNAQAAGGMLGTPQNQQMNMDTASSLASKDYNDYIKNILGLFGSGLQGEQGLENQGYDASTSYGNMLGSVLGQQANNAFNSQQAKNAGQGQGWSNIFSGAGNALASYLSGQKGKTK